MSLCSALPSTQQPTIVVETSVVQLLGFSCIVLECSMFRRSFPRSAQFITACAVATSYCISDVSSQWEGAIFDPRSSEIWEAIDPKLKTKKHVLGATPHMLNMVKIGLGVWAGPIPSLSPHLGYPLFVFLYSCHAVPMRPLNRS